MKSVNIALLSDFGLEDSYVGSMKAVISDLSPGIPLIDITHLIPPGDIQRGAFILWQASQDFPPGTVFLCVVDPGVGTGRKAIYLQIGNRIYIGPDNGLFSYLLYEHDYSCWELSNPDFQKKESSNTFHGRDIFAPAAAHAARGISGDQFGVEVNKLVHLPQPVHKIGNGSLTGEILSRDRFGNLFTSLGIFKYSTTTLHLKSWITNYDLIIQEISQIKIKVGNQLLPLVQTFDSIKPGSCAGLIGSTGLLEIIANQASAEDLLGLTRGDPVFMSWG
jgi:S-adenosylmethionine hydrolase